MMRALVVARAKEAKQRRKRGDFESVEFGDLDDGLSGKKNSTSSPLFCSLSLSLSVSLSSELPQAFIWQLAFAAPASTLPVLRRSLALDDRVLRSALLARSAPVPKAPTTAAVAKAVRRKLASAGK